MIANFLEGQAAQIEVVRIVSMNPLVVSIAEGEWAADWDRIEWHEMRIVGNSLIDLICGISVIPRDQVVIKPNYSDPAAGQLIASVSYCVPAGAAARLDYESIQSILRSFMDRVTGADSTDGLFDPVHLSPDEELRVNEHVSDFLAKNSGKKISVPMQLKQGATDIGKYTGSFAKKPASQPLPDTGVREIVGVITLVDSTNRLIRVIDRMGLEYKMHYPGDTFRAEIFNSARDGEICRIEWQFRPRLKNDPIAILVRIEKIEPQLV